jgi:hypothetical protein
MRKINSNQKADILIMPNVFSNNTFKDIDKKSVDGIINILNHNEEKYFKDQMFYFNLQNLRQIKPLYLMNSVQKEKPFEMENYLMKITNSYEEFNINKMIKNMTELLETFAKNKDFIRKYITLNEKDIFTMKDNLIKYINLNNVINLSIQTQIQTQTEILKQIQINLQTAKYSELTFSEDNILRFSTIETETYENYFIENKNINIGDTIIFKDTYKIDDFTLKISINYEATIFYIIYYKNTICIKN